MMALPLLAAGLVSGKASAAPSACDAVAGNLVTNCGFETSGSWSVIRADPGGAAHTGSRSLFLGLSEVPTTTEQSVATVAGTTYSLSFWARNYSAELRFTFDVYFDGTKVGSYRPPAAFTEITASVTASSSTSILRFVQTNPVQAPGTLDFSSSLYSYGNIDDVVLLAPPPTGVPEPASLAVLGAGLAGLAGLGRRRRRTA